MEISSWKIHGKYGSYVHQYVHQQYLYVKFMENPWNIHGTSMEHPAFLEDFHAQPPLGHDVRSSRQQWREGHGHHRGGDLELAVPAMIVPSVIYYH